MTPTIENVSLVKEQSRPEVYFVCSNTKFWIPNPAEFDAMGFRWDKVQIVPDGTLTSRIPGTLDPFPSKPFVNPRSPVKPSDVHVSPPCPDVFRGVFGTWYGDCISEASIIRRNTMIAGWLVGDPYPNAGDVNKGLEDMLYNVVLDPDFIDRMYGNDGLSNALAGDIRLPGNPSLAVAPIRAKHSGRVLDVENASTSNGARIIQWDSHGGNNQRFRLEPVDSGHFMIVAQHSGKVLDVRDRSAANGALIQQWDYLGGDNQKWRLESLGDGYYRLVAKHSGKVLDVRGISMDNGALIQQWDYLGGDNQKWDLRYQERLLPVTDRDMDGNSRGITLNSFALAYQISLHCELNVWHVNSTEDVGQRNWTGRGDPPQGWIRRPFRSGNDHEANDDTWWPYDPVNPENSPSGNLRAGAYVLMKGTFWQDTSHDNLPWGRTHYGNDGYPELHPIDWMVRLESPPPHRRKTTAMIRVTYDGPPTPGTTRYSDSITLDPNAPGNPSVPGKELKVHTCRELVDGRFTFPDTVVRHDVRSVDEHGQPLDHVDYDIEVRSSEPGRPGRFKAVYIVTWQGQQTSNAAFVSQSVPSPMLGTQQHEVSVTMKNTGPTTWRPGGANPFRLGSQNPQDNSVWGTGRVDVPAEVAPGDEATFRFAVVAPPNRGGYNFQWRMVQEAVEWFGDFTPNLTVEVISKGTLNVWMEPSRPRFGTPATYTVRATDAESGLDVHGGKVTITNPSANPQVFDVNTPFTFTFRTQRILVDPRPPRVFETIYPEGTVAAPGYDPVDLDFG